MTRRAIAHLISLSLAFTLTACVSPFGCAGCGNAQLTDGLRHDFPPGSPRTALISETPARGFPIRSWSRNSAGCQRRLSCLSVIIVDT